MASVDLNQVLNKTIQSDITQQNTFAKADSKIEKQRQKPGRKTKPSEELCNKGVNFYLTAAQFDALKKLADDECLSIQAFSKKTILRLLKNMGSIR